jgi:predicted DsbA family dithiol-disulfide isomerase
VRVDKLRSTFEIDIAYRPFPLHPDTPQAGLMLEELFAGRDIDVPSAQSRISSLMAEEGLPYGQRTMTYNSRLAQELGKWADTRPDGDGIHDALFRAYFVHNVNLAEVGNLVKIAVRVGLPTVGAERVLVGRQFRGAVDADWQRSRALGLRGVPAFVIGERALVGTAVRDIGSLRGIGRRVAA